MMVQRIRACVCTSTFNITSYPIVSLSSYYDDPIISLSFYYISQYHDDTARSVEDETPNGHQNAKRNPNRNQETIVLDLFSFETLKREVGW